MLTARGAARLGENRCFTGFFFWRYAVDLEVAPLGLAAQFVQLSAVMSQSIVRSVHRRQALQLTRELLSRRVVVRLLLRLKARTWPSLVRSATSLSGKDKTQTGALVSRSGPGKILKVGPSHVILTAQP